MPAAGEAEGGYGGGSAAGGHPRFLREPPHAHPCSSVLIRAHPCSSVLIRAHPCSSVLIRAHPCSSVLIRAHPCSSVLIRAHPCSSVLIRAHPCSSVLIRAHPCSSVHIPIIRRRRRRCLPEAHRTSLHEHLMRDLAKSRRARRPARSRRGPARDGSRDRASGEAGMMGCGVLRKAMGFQKKIHMAPCRASLRLPFPTSPGKPGAPRHGRRVRNGVARGELATVSGDARRAARSAIDS